ncbi:MAG: hypothetical protein M5U19_09780, partial [Microthrixaceae bacterium]|nr:hypothetical protein [Microthrixaceae bacterium]
RRNIDQAYLGAVDLPASVQSHAPVGGATPTIRAFTAAGLSASPVDAHLWGSAVFLGRLAVTWAESARSPALTSADRWHVGIVHRRIESLLEQLLIDDVQGS